jgi:hypothetical protein
MKITGIARPVETSACCSSMPPMPGICTSVMRQSVSRSRSERRKSCAEAKLQAT